MNLKEVLSNGFVHLYDRGLIEIKGKDSRELLQRIITRDIKYLNNESYLYSLILTPKGKYLYDIFIFLGVNGNIFMDCHIDKINDLIEKIKFYRIDSDVKIRNSSKNYKVFYTYKVGKLDDCIFFKDPRDNKMGYRLISSVDIMGNFLDYELYNKNRIENLVIEPSIDMEEQKSFPLDYNMDKYGAIDFDKGCYVGQEVTTRIKLRNIIRKGIYKINCYKKFQIGDIIHCNDSVAGRILSNSDGLGMALLKKEFLNQNIEIKGNKIEVINI